ncbi:ATP-binding protein [Xanthobacter sp. AM11]|uniref:ATP-binding protein n=1 Tax=Xanthobacter sp. AM11 TaxID=3380643 RepID=UPI0039BF59B0
MTLPPARPAAAAGLPVAPARARTSLRAQVLGTVLAINAFAALVAGTVVVLNARVATQREMTASVAMAENMVREMADRFSGDPAAASMATLPLPLRHLRHVRFTVEDAAGRALPLPGTPVRDGEDGAPAWFARLVDAAEVSREVEVAANGVPLGRVKVSGVPDDEIAEVWDDVVDFAAVAVAVNAAILAALYLALGRVRADLGRFRGALAQLEHSHFSCRVAPPRTRELAEVAERFNALAAALDAARADNGRLNARLVSLQEDERRQIARELHDELGPLMFGLKASADSLRRAAAELPPPLGGRIAERTQGMVGIVERMQTANRRLLRKIRPAALDHVALADVLASLVADFRQHDPERDFRFAAGPLAAHYGPAQDATLYRCVQEGVTNALRHGDARTVEVGLAEEAGSGPQRHLRLTVADDGSGLKPGLAEGLGLTGMRERVRALGGACRLAPREGGGATLVVDIPVAGAAPAPTPAGGDPPPPPRTQAMERLRT